MQNHQDDPFFTPYELKERWKLSAGTLRNWRCHRRGPRYIKIGNSIRYPRSEVETIERLDEWQRS